MNKRHQDSSRELVLGISVVGQIQVFGHGIENSMWRIWTWRHAALRAGARRVAVLPSRLHSPTACGCAAGWTAC